MCCMYKNSNLQSRHTCTFQSSPACIYGVTDSSSLTKRHPIIMKNSRVNVASWSYAGVDKQCIFRVELPKQMNVLVVIMSVTVAVNYMYVQCTHYISERQLYMYNATWCAFTGS